MEKIKSGSETCLLGMCASANKQCVQRRRRSRVSDPSREIWAYLDEERRFLQHNFPLINESNLKAFDRFI